MHLLDCGLVGRLLRDGLEQVAAEVVQPNLEPEETFLFKFEQNHMHNGRVVAIRTPAALYEYQSLVESVNGYVCS